MLEIAELAALWRAVDSAALARFLMLLLGTGARPGAWRTSPQARSTSCAGASTCSRPAPPATGKRNPILPIVPVAHAVGVRAAGPLRRRAPYEVLAGQLGARAQIGAGLDRDVVPYTIRHTLATWMSEQNVPEGELVAWFGHGKESTTRRWYIKRRVYRPDYLAAAAAAVEDLLIAVKREAGGWASPRPLNPIQLAVCVSQRSQRPIGRELETHENPQLNWSGRRDSNPRPQPWQGCALPLSYARPPCSIGHLLHRETRAPAQYRCHSAGAVPRPGSP